MLPDLRTRAKLREFLLEWLKVSQAPELAKDTAAFPEFTPEVVSDLRTSLELSIDELLDSEPADFRQLLSSNSIFLNGRLAHVYDVELPDDAPFQKVTFQPDERSGVLSHPYLMASFAYTGTSSPIHRGVFISRSILGRRAASAAGGGRAAGARSAPGPDDARARSHCRPKPEACQSCHGMINPLGFTLEHFDAVGRFRQMEHGKPIDADGQLPHSRAARLRSSTASASWPRSWPTARKRTRRSSSSCSTTR